LAAVEAGDVTTADGGHRLLADEAAAKLCAEPGWVAVGAGDDGPAISAYGLSGALQSLVWSTHFYGWTDISFVIHGPYPDGAGGVLVIREFFDIDPGELWPELPAPPCRNVRVLTRHDDSDEFRIDIFNHLLHRRPLRSSTTAVRVLADDADIAGTAEPEALRAAVVGIVRQQKRVLDRLSEREVLTKFVESRYYAFCRWRQRTGDPWRPPAEVYARIKERPVPPPPSGDDLDWPVLRTIFDPRCELPDLKE
jgi:hypothetical protein